ncbi:site-specific integrase [Paracraurococcus lichenis]|uniref:Uncharacterized protein n=1 Tax=Paracraurococcus lichenis TaxID=3064888 RepID=A0ABT9EDJ6_9PROT|nr:hypothetical protein [Paracraurococcus sp. LOR1-02]MDO9714146.1 hypothetical protein [Paracraurococcus sp. LOR1-02]
MSSLRAGATLATLARARGRHILRGILALARHAGAAGRALTTAEGLRRLLPRSKGDQEGQGASLGIVRGTKPETCPVRALEAWLQAGDCRYGPVFRRVDRWGTGESRALTPEAVGHILNGPLAVQQ